LTSSDKVTSVTLGWDNAPSPEFFHDTRTINPDPSSANINAHAGVLTAYDPTQMDPSCNPAPWGFINFWTNGGDYLYWMSDADFQAAYNFDIAWIGSNNVVIISNTP